MNQYYIRYIHLLPAFKFGATIGGIAMFLPGLITALLTSRILHDIRVLLESWQNLAGSGWFSSQINLIELLGLTGFLQTVQKLDDNNLLFIFTVIALFVLAGGLMQGLSGFFAAACYNFVTNISGGLVIEADNLNPMPATVSSFKGSTAMLPTPNFAPPPTMPQQQVYLTLKNDPQKFWGIPTGRITIGSAAGNEVLLPNLQPFHAQIRLEQGNYVLHSLNNAPLQVNGRLVSQSNLLKDNWTVTLGIHELIFHQR
jgi:hypothetical protein